MKTTFCSSLGMLALCAALSGPLIAEDKSSGFVDFGKFTAASGREFVEVNIKTSLISLAARLVEPHEPKVAGLLRNLQGVRVNVIGLGDENREEVEGKIKSLREELEGKGWERIVTVQKDKEDVGVYLKLRGEEAVEGIVVTVLEGTKEAVFVNIVGNIKPEEIATVAEEFDIEPLKKIKIRKAEKQKES